MEKRKLKRFYFHYTPVSAQIIFEDKRVEVNLHDINHKGYAFYIPPKSSGKYKSGDNLVLSKIHGIDLPKALIGSIVHCSERKLTKKRGGHTSVLVGVELVESSKLLEEVAKSL